MDCPRCAEPLVQGSFGDVAVHMCQGCASVIVALSDSIALFEQVGAGLTTEEIAAPLVPHADEGVRSCPKCTSPMDRFGYMGTDEVVLDRCSPCGHLFLDVEEVTAAATLFVRTRGRVEANRREADEHVEVLEATAAIAMQRQRMLGGFQRWM